jgi:hypothetical protein
MTTLFYKIPPNLPLTKGGIIPSLEKRGTGRFSDKCQFNYKTLNNNKKFLTLTYQLQNNLCIYDADVLEKLCQQHIIVL